VVARYKHSNICFEALFHNKGNVEKDVYSVSDTGDWTFFTTLKIHHHIYINRNAFFFPSYDKVITKAVKILKNSQQQLVFPQIVTAFAVHPKHSGEWRFFLFSQISILVTITLRRRRKPFSFL